jgi:hypothetical protein
MFEAIAHLPLQFTGMPLVVRYRDCRAVPQLMKSSVMALYPEPPALERSRGALVSSATDHQPISAVAGEANGNRRLAN